MGLLRLMGNKADVVNGLAKRCNEQWLVAPKSDIVIFAFGTQCDFQMEGKANVRRASISRISRTT